jgi:hypothetical protein
MALATLDQLGKLFHAVQLKVRLTVIVTVNHRVASHDSLSTQYIRVDEPGRCTWS